MMHRAPRLAERSMCRVPCSNYGSVRLGRSVRSHRCQRRGEERSVAGSQAEEPPNQRTRRNNVAVAVAGRPPHRFIRSLRQRVLIQMGYYSGGRIKEDLDGFRYSLDARGIVLLSSSLLLSSSASFPPFRMARGQPMDLAAADRAAGFTRRCLSAEMSGVLEPLSRLPPLDTPSGGPIAFPRILDEPRQSLGLQQIWMLRCGGYLVACD